MSINLGRRRFVMQSLAVAAAGEMSSSGAIKDAAASVRLPAWRRSLDVGAWITIPGTAMTGCDLSAQIEAGLCGPRGENIGFGNPRKGIMDFSGGTLKRDGSEMLVFGGGGAGAWAGNDVRGLRLEDDRPAWRTRIAPTPARFVHQRRTTGQTAHPYLLNGDPNARHSYFQPQFDDDADRFYALGCQNVWEVDQGTFNNVDSAPLNGSWNSRGNHPPIPLKRAFDGSWTCKHPRTAAFYVSGNNGVSCFDPARNAWTPVFTSAVAGVERATAAIDPDANTLLRIGMWGSRNRVPVAIELDRGHAEVGELTGPFADALLGYASAGMAWDEHRRCFLCFQDDGWMYTITLERRGRWIVDRIDASGTPPPAKGSSVHSGGPCAIWGRMQYVHALRGVCILQRYDAAVYYMRTA